MKQVTYKTNRTYGGKGKYWFRLVFRKNKGRYILQKSKIKFFSFLKFFIANRERSILQKYNILYSKWFISMTER